MDILKSKSEVKERLSKEKNRSYSFITITGLWFYKIPMCMWSRT